MKSLKHTALVLPLLIVGCLEQGSKQSDGASSSTPVSMPNQTNPSSGAPSPNPSSPTTTPTSGSGNSSVSPVVTCNTPDRTSPGFDCNGRSLYYPESQFNFKDVNAPHSVLTEAQLDSANEILVCSKIGAVYCNQICVNQAFNFRHRFALLKTGYIWPNAQCAYYIFEHNNQSGLVSFEYFEGLYQTGSGVVGKCTGTNLAAPTSFGYYGFTENRVPAGQISPAPDHSRLYYSLDMLDVNEQPAGRYILSNYQPMFDSNVVYAFDRPFGSIYVHFDILNGFDCVKRNEITPAAIDLIR